MAKLSLWLKFRPPVRPIGIRFVGHNYSTVQPRWHIRHRNLLRGLGVGIVGGCSLALLSSPIHLESPQQHTEDGAGQPKSNESLLSLLRTYLVYSACSVSFFVDNGISIISTVQSIPVVKQVSETVIRHTFFDQFVGGETALETFPIMESLRGEGIGSLLVYSAEVHEEHDAATKSSKSMDSTYKERVAEIARSIDAAGEFEANNKSRGLPRGKTWVAVKLTALLPDADSIERLSTYLCQDTSLRRVRSIPFPSSPTANDLRVLSARSPGSPLTSEDIVSIKELYENLHALCQRAQAKGVTVVFDSEHSWYTPAIDAIVLGLTREFNRPTSSSSTPLVYGTYQSYLRRGLPHLQVSLEDARREGYMIGVKLVRGAYQELEVAVHQKRQANGTLVGDQPEPPVWTKKSDTDNTFNESAALLIKSLKNDRLKGGAPMLGVMFATHNEASCQLVIDHLVENGLATRISDDDSKRHNHSSSKYQLDNGLTGRFSFAQLYGMRDDLTEALVRTVAGSDPIAMKYLPYGSLEDVIPYLARRATENKSVLGGDGEGGAAAERKLAGAKLKRKIFGFWRSA